MASLFTRKLLKKLGLLEIMRLMKRKVLPPVNAFMPCNPHLLIAVNRSLRWIKEKGLTEGSDYLEFGIFRGFTLWYAQALANDMEIKDMRFFGFDSFFGLPPISGIDKGGDFQEGAFYCPRKDVETFLTQYGVDWNNTFLVEGEFKKILTSETIRKYNLRQCSLCVIDCDLYESARLVLTFIESLIQHQSIL